MSKPLLIKASKDGNLEVVKYILENKLESIDVKDDNGNTALIWTSRYGHVEIVKELLKNGANVNEKTKYGTTALIWASLNDHVEVVKELKNGANANEKDNNGNTALNWASLNGHTEIVKLLEEQAPKQTPNPTPIPELKQEFEIISKKITYENVSKTIHKAISEYDPEFADSCLEFSNSVFEILKNQFKKIN